jgi:hypothetical protein
LDFAAYQIADGDDMVVAFQTGMMTGSGEIAVKYIHADRRFEIVPTEMYGRTIPDSTFKPAVGDTYAVFGISLPPAYVCNNSTKTGASWDMYREAVKYLRENEDQKFTFTGELDGIWAKRDWLNIGGKIKLGGYILFSDNQFQPTGIKIRIVGIKDLINNPHSPTIELSNEIVGGSVYSELRKIGNAEVAVTDLHKEALQFAKRRYRDSIESMGMIKDAMLGYFTGAIQPISVQTMSMLAGDESLQFKFMTSLTSSTTKVHNVTYAATTKILKAPQGYLRHFTLGIRSISASHKVAEYKTWNVAAFTSPALTEVDVKYYLYAKVGKETTAGEFILSETAITMEQEADYYHLLIGILNSEYSGERSFVPLYGFTEILPGRVTTDKVVSSSGYNYIDFLNNAMRMGNNGTFIDFNSAGDGKLRLKGTLVQSADGIESQLACDRGEWDSTASYQPGDTVYYGGSLYKWTTTGSGGVGSKPSTSPWWTRIIDGGVPGPAGPAGPSILYRGDYSSTATYTGSDKSVDVVYYAGNKTFYMAKASAGSFSAKVPTNTTYWESFGASFESVATKVLFAENANIGGWIFKNSRLESQSGGAWMDGVNGKASFASGKVLLNADGSGQLANGGIIWDKDGNTTVKGVIDASQGLRSRVQYITNANSHIDASTVFAILCNVPTSSTIPDIYLPDDPIVGQMLTIKNYNYGDYPYTAAIRLQTQGNNIHRGKQSYVTMEIAQGCVVQMIYTIFSWQVTGWEYFVN